MAHGMARQSWRSWDDRHQPDQQGQPPSRLWTDDDPATTIKGMGFKNVHAAQRTIQLCSQRGVLYKANWSVRAMAERARHHPNQTPDMRAALRCFEAWLSSDAPQCTLEQEREEREQRQLLACSAANAHARSRCSDDDQFRRLSALDRRDAFNALKAAGRMPRGRSFELSPTAFVSLFGGPGDHGYGRHVCDEAMHSGLEPFRCTCSYERPHSVHVSDASSLLGDGFPLDAFVLHYAGVHDSSATLEALRAPGQRELSWDAPNHGSSLTSSAFMSGMLPSTTRPVASMPVAQVATIAKSSNVATAPCRRNVLTSAMLSESSEHRGSTAAQVRDSTREAAAEMLLSRRCIVSLDIDCFYAQAEELRRPELRGTPIGVQQKMLIITSNYAARAFGILKGDSVSVVRAKCPHITIVPGEDLTFYRFISQRVFDVVSEWSPHVERLGMDELFIDLTELVDSRLAAMISGEPGSNQQDVLPTPHGYVYPSDQPGEADQGGGDMVGAEATCATRLAVCSQICADMREQIRQRVGLSTSAGISVSKLLAKMVASEHKPDKQTILMPRAVSLTALLPPSLPISRIPGIGFAATRRWQEIGINTIGELVAATEVRPIPEHISHVDVRDRDAARRLCLGLCEQPVVRSGAPKSVGAEDSFWARPLDSIERAHKAATVLSRQLLLKLRQDERSYGCRQPSTLAVTVRHHSSVMRKGGSRDGNVAKRQTRHEKLGALTLGRVPPVQFDVTVPPTLSDRDDTLAAQLTTRAMLVLRKLVPATSFQLDILNLSVRFDGSGTHMDDATGNSIRNHLHAMPVESRSDSCSTAGPRAPSPDAADTQSACPSASKEPSSTASRTAGTIEMWSVNPADIDSSIIDELPADIQAEIRRGMWLSTRGNGAAASRHQPPSKRVRTMPSDSGNQRTMDAFLRR